MTTIPRKILRALAEIGFIVFLFYTNLLMGQYTHSHTAQREPGLVAAVHDILTPANAVIGSIGAIIGYLLIEAFRRSLKDD